MAPTLIAAWSNFLVAQVGASAALTGLVFVAVSINLPRILELPGVPGRAAESICQLFAALVLATTLLIPDQSAVAIGWEMVSIGALVWILQTVLQVRQLRAGFTLGRPRAWIYWRIALSQFATLPFCIAGILVLSGSPGGLYWIAPGYIFSLLSGVASAWVLLIEILR